MLFTLSLPPGTVPASGVPLAAAASLVALGLMSFWGLLIRAGSGVLEGPVADPCVC